jgi:hypothetical protein
MSGDNFLGLPSGTEVNRRITKEKICANVARVPQLRDAIKDWIESVVVRNRLAPDNIGISAGETIREVFVIEVRLRQRELDKRVLPAIAKAILYKTVFVLTFSGESQACIEASGMFYNTDWQPLDILAATLKIEGLNLDAVYENFARHIAGGRLGTGGDIEDAVGRDKQRQKLIRDIAALEKKISREKQLNRKMELNDELKRLKRSITNNE